jgi:hypothetical protein
MFHHQNAEQNNIKTSYGSFENVKFRYFEMTVTNQNLIQEKIKRKLNLGNACYHSIYNLLSSRLLSKNIKIRIHKIIILHVDLCGCETWSLTLREEYRLKVFENRMLRRILRLKRDTIIGGCRRLHEDHQNLYALPNIIRTIKTRMRWAGHIPHIEGRTTACRILVGNSEGSRPLGRPNYWIYDCMQLYRYRNGEGTENATDTGNA